MRLLDRWPSPPAPRLKPDLRGWESRTLAAAWIGHATVLLRLGGLTILTDPVFSSRIGLGLGLLTAGPKRHVRPALEIDELPPLDLILVSHAHFDHLDLPSLARLDRRTPVVTSWKNRDLLAGFSQITELAWGESARIAGLKITAREVRHWGARTLYDRYRGYAAFELDNGQNRVLFGADSAYQEKFQGLSPVDLAILGIGAYDPYIFAHATPEQVWAMANHAQARHILPIHHSTFRLSHEPMHEPLERLLKAAGPEARRIVAREIGAVWENPG